MMNKLELQNYLQTHGINSAKWGTGESKTLDHLVAEVILGESALEESDKRILRVVIGVGINVFFNNLKLVEEKQIFIDGRERRRKLYTSVGEKMKPGETPLEAASRTLREELGISEVDFSSYRIERREPIPSTSFPGLWTKNTVHIYDANLPPKDFRSEGYVETQSDKTTYFIWQTRSTR